LMFIKKLQMILSLFIRFTDVALHRLQKIKSDLEMVLLTVQLKNKKLEEDLESLKVRGFDELKNKIMTLKTYKKELLSALGEFLDEHFPLRLVQQSGTELLTLHISNFILINKLMTTPHEPYVTINESFWPPYIELLLRYGIVLRHPEDPKRLRLEAFHK
uniref:Uncharacterized protein n=1 Tax=Corvus moneduloides TaxID=1196302 RepID=A0A8C3DFB6_CORMO